VTNTNEHKKRFNNIYQIMHNYMLNFIHISQLDAADSTNKTIQD